MAAKVAKVAMVAVPTVLGIASIRVYRVSEPPTEGLIPHDTLSIYNALPQSTGQFQFVAEKPGALENGFGYTRETVVVPCVQAVQGACVSVKNGGLHIYHAGEDVYHFLKDPPAGFVPRVGCITMAGLLGAFLARKGSRLQRVAAPLGMATAGAAVCYPAQTVAVVKLTSKKIYSAGQWSGSTVSSLFKSKPKELPAPPPQPEDVPKSESPVVEESPAPEVPPAEGAPSSDTETLVESVAAEPLPAPVGEEPAAPVVTEEPSPADQSPGAVLEGVPAAEPVSEALIQTPELTTSSTAVETPPDECIGAASQEPSGPTSTEESAPAESSTPAAEEPPEEVLTPTSSVVEESSPPPELSPAQSTSTEAVVEAIPAASEEPASSPEQTSPPTTAETELTIASQESIPVSAEASPEAVSEASSEAVSEASPEPVVEAVSEASPEPVVEAVSEASPEAVAEAGPAVVEASTVTEPPPAPVQTEAAEDLPAETSGGEAAVQADPATMDFGQSSPEDDDLYSTRTS